MLHTCTLRLRRDIFGHLYFDSFIVILISLYKTSIWIMPIPLQCEPRPVPRAILAVSLNDRCTTQGSNTHDLCVRITATRLAVYPVTLCIMFTSGKLHAVTFAVGVQGASLHPSTTIKRLGLLLMWAFDHKLISKSLLTARLVLGIQQ